MRPPLIPLNRLKGLFKFCFWHCLRYGLEQVFQIDERFLLEMASVQWFHSNHDHCIVQQTTQQTTHYYHTVTCLRMCEYASNYNVLSTEQLTLKYANLLHNFYPVSI